MTTTTQTRWDPDEYARQARFVADLADPVVALLEPRAGERVLLKPNFIRESHAGRPDEWEQITTHGAVIAAVAYEVAAVMDGRGTLTIADAPQTDSDFDKICERAELPALRKRFSNLKFEILDLRREAWRTERGVIVERRKLPEDPRGYTDLGQICSAVNLVCNCVAHSSMPKRSVE